MHPVVQVGIAAFVAVVVAAVRQRRGDDAGLGKRQRRVGMAAVTAAVAVGHHHERQRAGGRRRIGCHVLHEGFDVRWLGGGGRGIPNSGLDRRVRAIGDVDQAEANRAGGGGQVRQHGSGCGGEQEEARG